ncbi:MAG: hypothetical protein HY681_00680 [Chloroflexi bacterium]|nr:hypothetical protein [Chloroflexota bacterium]
MEARIAREVLILFGFAALIGVSLPLLGVGLFSPGAIIAFLFLVAIRVFIWAVRVTLRSRRKPGASGPSVA